MKFLFTGISREDLSSRKYPTHWIAVRATQHNKALVARLLDRAENIFVGPWEEQPLTVTVNLKLAFQVVSCHHPYGDSNHHGVVDLDERELQRTLEDYRRRVRMKEREDRSYPNRTPPLEMYSHEKIELTRQGGVYLYAWDQEGRMYSNKGYRPLDMGSLKRFLET